MVKASDYARVCVEFPLEERLAFACQLVAAVRDIYGNTPSTARTLDRLKVKHVREAFEERTHADFSDEERLLLVALLQA